VQFKVVKCRSSCGLGSGTFSQCCYSALGARIGYVGIEIIDTYGDVSGQDFFNSPYFVCHIAGSYNRYCSNLPNLSELIECHNSASDLSCTLFGIVPQSIHDRSGGFMCPRRGSSDMLYNANDVHVRVFDSFVRLHLRALLES
jgi:hypothetical protein